MAPLTLQILDQKLEYGDAVDSYEMWHCCLCHHEVQLGGARPNTLCTQRGQCAQGPMCLLCQYERVASLPASRSGGTAGGASCAPPSPACPPGRGADHSVQDTCFLSSLFSSFFFLNSLKWNVRMSSVQPHEFSQPATPLHPAGQEPECAQPPTSPPVTLQPSSPARLTALLMSNIQQFTCLKPHNFGNFLWHLKPAYYVSVEQGMVPAQPGTD